MTEIWIADPQGAKARVMSPDARNEFVMLHGWSDTTEPVDGEFQWVRHVDHGGRAPMVHEAVPLHAELGWVPCGPPGYDDPAPTATKSSPSKSASSGDKKE